MHIHVHCQSLDLFSLYLKPFEMADLCFSVSSLSQYYDRLICSYFVFLPFIFSHHLYFSDLINISLLLLLPLIYHDFTPRLSQHCSGFVVSTYHSDKLSPQLEVYENVCLFDETSSFHAVECSKVKAYEPPVSEEIHESDSISGGGHGSNFGKYGYTGQEEEWKNTLAWKLFEERHYNVVEGDEDMDSLWEAFEADSIKSRHIDVVVKKKDIKKKSGELDKNNSNEDDNDDEVEMTSGCLQGLNCCSAGVGKKNMKRGRSSIVKSTKPLNLINWWCHLKRHAKRNILLI